ncbi:hypothetical protein HK405_009955, partial [Cladochytrium tenue]
MAVQLATRPRHFFCPRIPAEPNISLSDVPISLPVRTATPPSSPSASPRLSGRVAAALTANSGGAMSQPGATDQDRREDDVAAPDQSSTSPTPQPPPKPFLYSLLSSSAFSSLFRSTEAETQQPAKEGLFLSPEASPPVPLAKTHSAYSLLQSQAGTPAAGNQPAELPEFSESLPEPVTADQLPSSSYLSLKVLGRIGSDILGRAAGRSAQPKPPSPPNQTIASTFLSVPPGSDPGSPSLSLDDAAPSDSEDAALDGLVDTPLLSMRSGRSQAIDIKGKRHEAWESPLSSPAISVGLLIEDEDSGATHLTLALLKKHLEMAPSPARFGYSPGYDIPGFLRLVGVFQTYISEHYAVGVKPDEALQCAIYSLRLLYDANEFNQAYPRAPISSFYNDSLNKKVNFKEEYRSWKRSDLVTAKGSLKQTAEFSLFDYPFLFDPVSKSRVMHIDAMVQMSQEFEEAVVHQAIVIHAQRFLQDSPSILNLEQELKGATNPFLVLEVRRQHL